MASPLRSSALPVLLAFVALAGCAAGGDEAETDEPATQESASTMQLGTEDFCGTLFREGSRAPKKIGDDAITYDWNGRVSAIGDARVSYNFFGPVASIGDDRVSYNLVTVSSVGDRRVERSLRGRVSAFDGEEVSWSLTLDRPAAIGDAELTYDLVGHLSRVGDDEVGYGSAWDVRLVTSTNRFALCLAVYLHATREP